MGITTGEKIRILLKRRNMSMGKLAEVTEQSRQNLSNKLRHDNFADKDLRQIAEALDCSYAVEFRMNDTGENI